MTDPQPSFNMWSILLLLAAAQGVFLALVLCTHRRGNRRANHVLALLIFLFSLRLLETVAYWTKYLLVFPHGWLVTGALQFLFGVLLFFYAKILTTENFKFKPRDAWQLLPFALQTAWLARFYVLPGAVKLSILRQFLDVDNPETPWLYFLVALAQITHMLVYTVLTWRVLREHSTKLQNGALTLARMSSQWLRQLTVGFGSFVLLLLLYVIALQLGFPYSRGLDALVLVCLAGLIYAIGFMTLRRPEIFSGALAVKVAPKYEKSALTPARAEACLAKLQHVMAAEKLYRNSELKLADLAEKLALSPHHLSQIINEKLGQNFFDFINHYRIAEAQQWLDDPTKQNYTILSIALEIGFNNKASFNAAFKKHTGMTPSHYRDVHVKADKV